MLASKSLPLDTSRMHLVVPRPGAALVACLSTLALTGSASAQYGTLATFGSGVTTAGDMTGHSVAILGDVNGDGTDDMLIGAPYDDYNGTDSGTVYVVNGSPAILLYKLHGSSPFDHFGEAVANIGDAGGDGIDDIIVGAPGKDFNGSDTGAITVFSGADGTAMYSQVGPKAGSNFGAAVAGGGDFNGDGHSDFLVGAPGWYPTVVPQHLGWVGVYSGLAGNPIKTIPGAGITEQFGHAVAVVGDLNGDGRADYAIGSPGYDYVTAGGVPVTDGGRLRVFSGANHAQLYTKQGKSGQLLGWSVARAGDTDSDGVPEVIVGAPGHASLAGTAYLYEGSSGALLHQFFGYGFTATDKFGYAVAPLGDVNHDGHDDLLIGAPLYYWEVGLGGYVVTFSGATYAPYGIPLTSPDAGDRLGSALSASSGDLNGDDWTDVLVGLPRNDFAGIDCGVVKSYTQTFYQPDLHFQGPGTASLVMYGTQLYPGGIADLALLSGKPNSPAYLIASQVELLAPFMGGTLVPSVSPAIIVPFMTDAQGRVKITDIPGGGGPAILFIQFLIQDSAQPKGWQLSNAIAAGFLP